MSERMSEEDLARIRRDVACNITTRVQDDRRNLVAEIDALRAKLAAARADALEEAAKAIDHNVAFYHGSIPVRLVKTTPPTDAHGRLYANLVRGLKDDEGTRALKGEP